MKYSYIFDGKIGRIDTDELTGDCNGLCTDNFTSCNIIVLVSENRKRLVLIHADMSISAKHLQEQIEWVGANAKQFLILRDESGYPSQPAGDIKKKLLGNAEIDANKFKIIVVPNEIETVAITQGQDEPDLLKTFARESFSDNILYHPQTSLLFMQHTVESHFGSIPPLYELAGFTHNYLAALLFESGAWTKYPEVCLSEFVSEHALKRHKITSKTPAFQIFNILSEESSSETGRLLAAAAEISIFYFLTTTTDHSKEAFLKSSYAPFLETAETASLITPYIGRLKNVKCKPELDAIYEELSPMLEDQGPDLITQTNILFTGFSMLLRFPQPGRSMHGKEPAPFDRKIEGASAAPVKTQHFYSSNVKFPPPAEEEKAEEKPATKDGVTKSFAGMKPGFLN